MKVPEAALYTCPKCRQCTVTVEPRYDPICPMYEEFGFATYSGAGILKIGRGLMEGGLGLEEALAPLAKCTLCRACDRCPIGGNPSHLVQEMRREAHRTGVPLPPEQRPILDNLRRTGNPFGTPSKREEATGGPAETLLLPGCAAAHFPDAHGAADGLRGLLGAARVPFATLGLCCGALAWQLGDTETWEKRSEAILKAVQHQKGKTLVVSQAHCHRALTRETRRFQEAGVEVLHTTQYVARLHQEGKLRFKANGRETITYHDPCEMARGCKLTEEPRRLLEAAGYTLAEMPRNRDDLWCCGAGSGVLQSDPDYARRTARKRVEEARATGASTLCSACPQCELSLRRAGGMEVADVMELLARRV